MTNDKKEVFTLKIYTAAKITDLYVGSTFYLLTGDDLKELKYTRWMNREDFSKYFREDRVYRHLSPDELVKWKESCSPVIDSEFFTNPLYNMKRSAIKLGNKEIVKYCKAENGFQQKVYARKVAAKTMTPYKANQNILIIRELRELVEDMEQKGVTWHQLRKMIADLPEKRGSVQGTLNIF